MHTLDTSVDIEAPPATVWAILADFERYPDWNPFIREVRGEARQGARLTVHVRPDGGRAMTFRPKVLSIRPPHELRWLGRLMVPGLFDGEHIFEIEDLPGGRSRVIHREQFTGLLVPLIWKGMAASTRAGFEAMNTALKRRAESTG